MIKMITALAVATTLATASPAASVYNALEDYALNKQVKYHIECHPEDDSHLVETFYRNNSVEWTFIMESIMDTYWTYKRNVASSKAYKLTKQAIDKVYASGLGCD